jgi:hypothetical protein
MAQLIRSGRAVDAETQRRGESAASDNRSLTVAALNQRLGPARVSKWYARQHTGRIAHGSL